MGDPITLGGGSGAQSLEIVVDDRPATLTGMVTENDRPVSKSYVVLVRWPLTAEFVYRRLESAEGADDGQFRLTDLAPGEYRAIAVSQTNRDKLDEPGVLQRLLTGTDSITLGRGSVRAITLKLSAPAR